MKHYTPRRLRHEPRLQNIPPPRTKIGDVIREAFRGEPLTLGMDFAEIERRIVGKTITVNVSNRRRKS